MAVKAGGGVGMLRCRVDGQVLCNILAERNRQRERGVKSDALSRTTLEWGVRKTRMYGVVGVELSRGKDSSD